MTNVTFNEEKSAPSQTRSPKGLYKLAIKLGLAKDEREAKVVLLAVALIAALVAVIYPLLVL
jgi:hypothetical protein